MSPRVLVTLTVLFAVVAATLALSAAFMKHRVEGHWDIVPITGGIVLLALAYSAWSRYRGMMKKK